MRERASERPNDRQDGFMLRFRQASRASENRDFLHAKFNARIPAIAAMLDSAFRSCQPILLLFSFFSRAREQTAMPCCTIARARYRFRVGRSELLSRAFIERIHFLYYIGRFYPRVRPVAPWDEFRHCKRIEIL